jgi:hypothetical protein
MAPYILRLDNVAFARASVQRTAIAQTTKTKRVVSETYSWASASFMHARIVPEHLMRRFVFLHYSDLRVVRSIAPCDDRLACGI